MPNSTIYPTEKDLVPVITFTGYGTPVTLQKTNSGSMLDILSITGPIYLTIFLGYLTTRMGLFAKADMQVLGRFVINLALPALLFKVSSQRQLGEIINVSYLFAYLVGSLLVVGGGYLWSRRVGDHSPMASTFNVMGMSCSNSGFVGYPVLLIFLPPIAGVCLALNLIVENLVILPLLLAMAEQSRGGDLPWHRLLLRTLSRLVVNPLIIALIAGVCVSLAGIGLPVTVARTVSLFALSSSALSLFFIGGTLVGVPFRGIGSRIVSILLGKLVFHPLAVFITVLLLPLVGLPALDASMARGAVILAAVPMMSIYSILALKYGQEEVCSAAVLITTTVSFFSLSLLLWGVEYFL